MTANTIGSMALFSLHGDLRESFELKILDPKSKSSIQMLGFYSTSCRNLVLKKTQKIVDCTWTGKRGLGSICIHC